VGLLKITESQHGPLWDATNLMQAWCILLDALLTVQIIDAFFPQVSSLADHHYTRKPLIYHHDLSGTWSMGYRQARGKKTDHHRAPVVGIRYTMPPKKKKATESSQTSSVSTINHSTVREN